MTDDLKEKISLRVTTPRGLKFTEQADFISMVAIDGEVGILPRHAPYQTILGDGTLRIRNDGETKLIALFGGVLEVHEGSEVDIYTTIAQSPEEIDEERAEEDRQKAEEILRQGAEDIMLAQCRMMLTQSKVRLEVSQDFDSRDYDTGD